jgi:hypothetical protein
MWRGGSRTIDSSSSSGALLKSGDEAGGVYAGADFGAGRGGAWLAVVRRPAPAPAPAASRPGCSISELLGRDRLSAADMEAPQPLPLGMTERKYTPGTHAAGITDASWRSRLARLEAGGWRTGLDWHAHCHSLRPLG